MKPRITVQALLAELVREGFDGERHKDIPAWWYSIATAIDSDSGERLTTVGFGITKTEARRVAQARAKKDLERQIQERQRSRR